MADREYAVRYLDRNGNEVTRLVQGHVVLEVRALVPYLTKETEYRRVRR